MATAMQWKKYENRDYPIAAIRYAKRLNANHISAIPPAKVF